MALRRHLKVRVQPALTITGLILTALFAVSTNAPDAQAAQTVPYLINFQGRLTNTAGTTVANGNYNIRFTLYDALTGGTNRWQGSRVYGASDYRVTVTNGLFNIQFGDTTKGDPALSPSLFNTQTYANLYLEVELPTPATATCATNGCAVFTEGPMTPRQRVASAPYAMQADTLDGLDSDAFVQLTPSGQQTGSINISSSVQAASLQVTGAVQGASATYTGTSTLTLGTAGPAGNTGAVLFKNATNANTLTLQSGASGSTFAITLPTALAASGDCLKDSTGAGVLAFASCSAGVSLQTAYDGSSTPAQITTSATAKNVVIKSGVGFNSTGAFQVIPDGTATPAFTVDTQNSRVGIGVAAPAESLELAGALRVGTTANSNAGTIRWNGTDFQGYDGSNWLALSNSGLVQTTPTVSKRKTSVDTSLASTTTFTPEADLSFDVGAGEDWAFHYYVQASVGSAPDIKFRINTPSGGTCVWTYQNVEDAVSQGNNACNASVAITITTAGPLNDGIDLFGSINNPTTAGTVSLDWAPNVSSATATIFRRGSALTAFRASGTNNPFQAVIDGGNNAAAALQFGTTTSQDVVLLTNGTEKLRVDTSGNLKLASSPTASATAALLELDAAIAGGSASGTFIGANPASFSGDFLNLQVNGATKYKVNNFGDQTAGMTQLDGSTTTNGTGTNSTSMTVTSSANFNIGNYIQLANTAACQTGGPTTCYSKITNIVGNVLTITPALTWATARPVVEYHVPEIGATNTASTLANRYGRGYFISGVATGNGTTYYNEDGIETDLTDYAVATAATNLVLGGASSTVSIPGAMTVAGQSIVNGSGQINGAQLQTGTVATGALASSSVTVTAGTNLSGGGAVALGSAVTLNVSATPSFTSITSGTYSGSAAVTLSSGGSSNLTLDSVGGTVLLGTNTTTIQKAANALTIDLATAGASTLNILNSNGANVTNVSVDGGLSTGAAITAPTSTNTINGLVISSGTISTGAWQGTAVGATYGGTGLNTFAVGDLVYADTTTTLARRAAVASGSCLISAGVSTAPVWGSCGGGGGATTQLDNLGTTSINAALLPSANNTRSLGSAALVWQNLFTGNVDAGTTSTALTIGTAATTTAITIGRSGLQVSIPGGVTSTGGITTSSNISTSGTGTITSAGAFVGPTATNTINGVVISSGSINTGTWAATTVAANRGGTGNAAYAVGDLLYADTTSTLARRAAVASGSCLISAGVSTAPVWGSCGSGATTQLDNLGTTSINAALFPSTTNSIDLGSTAATWQDGYFGTSVVSPLYTSAAALTVDSATTSALNIGTGANAKTITIGNATGATTVNILAGTGHLQVGTVDATATLFVVDTKNSAGDPADANSTNGGIYYNSVIHQFRCYRDGDWHTCGLNPIDRGFITEEEFTSGLLTTGNIGDMGWTLSSGGTSTLTYNTTMLPTADRPGTFGIQTGATSGNGSTIWLGGNGTTGTMTLSDTNVMKAGVAVGATIANTILRVGMHNETTTSTAPTSGVWWEANSSVNANWRYCYYTGATATCAASGVAVAASTWVRLEIRVTALGAGVSAATFIINGTASTVSAATIATATRVNPALSCFNSTAAARNCYIDYYQLRGVSSAAR